MNETTPGTGDRSSACYVCPLLQDLYICLSFKSPVTRNDYLGSRTTVDFFFESAGIPDWWNLDGCRTASGIALADATGEARSTTNCPGGDPLSGGTLNSFVFSHTNRFRGANTIRWVSDAVRFFYDPVSIAKDTKYYLCVYRVKYFIKTVVDCDVDPPDDTHVCEGCTTPGCFIFQQADYYFTGAEGAAAISDGAPYGGGTRQHVTWQAGWSNLCYTPTRNATWGSIKALYR